MPPDSFSYFSCRAKEVAMGKPIPNGCGGRPRRLSQAPRSCRPQSPASPMRFTRRQGGAPAIAIFVYNAPLVPSAPGPSTRHWTAPNTAVAEPTFRPLPALVATFRFGWIRLRRSVSRRICEHLSRPSHYWPSVELGSRYLATVRFPGSGVWGWCDN